MPCPGGITAWEKLGIIHKGAFRRYFHVSAPLPLVPTWHSDCRVCPDALQDHLPVIWEEQLGIPRLVVPQLEAFLHLPLELP